MTSYWARWRLKSAASWLFTQPVFRRRSKKTSKLRVTGHCEGNSPVTGELTTQRASKAENISIWWRHHEDQAGYGLVQYRISLNSRETLVFLKIHLRMDAILYYITWTISKVSITMIRGIYITTHLINTPCLRARDTLGTKLCPCRGESVNPNYYVLMGHSLERYIKLMIRYQELDYGKYWVYYHINVKLFSSFNISEMKKANRIYA